MSSFEVNTALVKLGLSIVVRLMTRGFIVTSRGMTSRYLLICTDHVFNEVLFQFRERESSSQTLGFRVEAMKVSSRLLPKEF